MSFTPRYTKPNPDSNYYSSWNRFSWLDVSPYGGNCTGYAYGRTNEIAERSVYNEFYINVTPANAKDWIYNSWQNYTHTSGTIDLHLGDIIVWGGGKYGHVEVIEAINGNYITVSGSVWANTYGASREFYIRTIEKPTWGSYLGVWYDNDGNKHDYSNTFIGYIHNPYAQGGPTPPTPTPTTTPEITISPSSYTKTMSSDDNYVDFRFDITITGIPNGYSVSGGNSYPDLSRVYNTGWSYTDYVVGSTTYRTATKTQTLRYERQGTSAYTTTKYMYYNLSFPNGDINSTTPMDITVQASSEDNDLIVLSKAINRKRNKLFELHII